MEEKLKQIKNKGLEKIENISSISELDEVMKAEFLRLFKQVQIEFNKVFQELFGGGEAHLELTDSENLLETGINMAKIYRTVFDVTTFEKTKLTARCLDRLELLVDGQISFTYVLRSDLDELKLEEADTDNIVNYGRNIDSVEVSVFAKQREGNTYKVSMRANEYVDVSVVASKFGGGGHVRAAGFETVMNLEQLKSTIVDEIKKQLK